MCVDKAGRMLPITNPIETAQAVSQFWGPTSPSRWILERVLRIAQIVENIVCSYEIVIFWDVKTNSSICGIFLLPDKIFGNRTSFKRLGICKSDTFSIFDVRLR